MFFSLLDLLRQTGDLPARLRSGDSPQITLHDEGEMLLLTARLHGIDPRSVQVQITESHLAIAGARTVEERTEGDSFVRMQSSVSSFYRVMPLPVPVEPRQAASQWQADGMLLVTLPKATRHDPFSYR